MKKSNYIALITGITGQDGSYLTELLIQNQYKAVYGLVRKCSTFNLDRICKNLKNVHLIYGDITDFSSLNRMIKKIKEEMNEKDTLTIYHLAAQSDVAFSFSDPTLTFAINATGTLNLLEAIRHNDLISKVLFYFAATSELFGLQQPPQNQLTPLDPKSPYAVSKVSAVQFVNLYREAYNLKAVIGYLFNHESPRRQNYFVLKKIVMNCVSIKRGTQDTLYLGNLNSKRDIGYAKEYVECIVKMMEDSAPVDFALGTGIQVSVREMVEIVFKKTMNLKLIWEGKGVEEIGLDQNTKKVYVKVSKQFFRPIDVDNLLCDPSLFRDKFNWKHQHSIYDLIDIMINEELQLYF